jgi:hypothetical protein
MLHKGLIEEGPAGSEVNEKVMDFIASLDAKQLLILRRAAEGLPEVRDEDLH